jgi:hypothetical protein
MRSHKRTLAVAAVAVTALALAGSAVAFEGRITAEFTQGAQTNTLLYTVGTNQLRIAITSTNWPNPINIVERESGAVALVFPHNRSFVRLKSADASLRRDRPVTESVPPSEPGMPPMPQPPSGLPPVIGPQPQDAPDTAGMPAMPPMPMMREKLDLNATTDTTNLFGFACTRYEAKQRGETLEVWATDKLMTFQPYLRNQPHRFGPRVLEEQWPGLLQERKLFPLRVSLRYDSGTERYRFEVKSVTAEKVADPEGKLFQPPKDYLEIEPLPF